MASILPFINAKTHNIMSVVGNTTGDLEKNNHFKKCQKKLIMQSGLVIILLEYMSIIVNKSQALLLIVTNHNISETVFCFFFKVSPRLLIVIEGKISVTRSTERKAHLPKEIKLMQSMYPKEN